jgi:hypothetical protein
MPTVLTPGFNFLLHIFMKYCLWISTMPMNYCCAQKNKISLIFMNALEKCLNPWLSEMFKNYTWIARWCTLPAWDSCTYIHPCTHNVTTTEEHFSPLPGTTCFDGRMLLDCPVGWGDR